MFVFLSKFLPPLIYPLGLAIALVAFAFLLRKRPRLRAAAEIAALLLLLLASNRWVSYSLARTLEWQYIPAGEIPPADVIILLGGATEPAQAPRPQVEVNSAGDRILYAAALYRQNKAPAILVSGGNINWLENRGTTPATDLVELLELTGVPRDAIWLEDQSQNTYENALYSARLLRQKGITRVILVTSAMHMPRSMALFRAQGFEPFAAPADFTVTRSGWAELTSSPTAILVNSLPNAGSLALTTNVLKEYIGLLAYRLKGWLSL
jgi:uncharacterized SAM-binding protein YcdF (DUF218 family)